MSRYNTLESGETVNKSAIDSSGGNTDAAKLIRLDSAGKLDRTFFPAGIGETVKMIVAGEALTAGDFVNVYDDSGAKVRKADNSNARVAHGFVLAAVNSGDDASVYFSGENTQVGSGTPGATAYLGTGGSETSTPLDPTASANVNKIHQVIGHYTTSGGIEFDEDVAIKILA